MRSGQAAYNRAYYLAHRAERIAAAVANNWRKKNPEKSRAADRAWYAKSYQRIRERKIVSVKKYTAAHPEMVNAWKVISNHRRRLQIRATETLSLAEWKAIVERHDGRCYYCGVVPKKITIDHVVPLSRGGRHEASNVVPACQSCNSRKGSKLLEAA